MSPQLTRRLAELGTPEIDTRDASTRRRLFFLAGKPNNELTSAEHEELFRLLAAWNAAEKAQADQQRLDSATMMIDPSYPSD